MHAQCTQNMYSDTLYKCIETHLHICTRTGIRSNYCANVLATGLYGTELDCAIYDVLFPAVFLLVSLILHIFCRCSQKTSILMHFLNCSPIVDIVVDR
jgi:hypothetical protein